MPEIYEITESECYTEVTLIPRIVGVENLLSFIREGQHGRIEERALLQ